MSGHDHEHPDGRGHDHGHGDPFVWDPDAEDRRRGVRYLVIGLVLIAVGVALWWLGLRGEG